MKNLMTVLGLFLFALIFTSCGSEDAEKNGEKAGKCACKMISLEIEKYELKEEQLETYDDGEIDDREEYAKLQIKINKIDLKQEELELKMEGYSDQKYAGENFHDEDDFEDWIEDFEDAVDDYIDDNCEDEEEDLEDAREDYHKEQRRMWEKAREREDRNSRDDRRDRGNRAVDAATADKAAPERGGGDRDR